MIPSSLLLLLASFITLSSQQELLPNQRCNHRVDRGDCQNFAVQWHYDRYAHRCRQFYYGGCGGNENRFETQQACESECTFVDTSVRERCSQPYDAGHCHSDISRHYFDMAKGACICANYTGCGGNNNMFYSFDQCMSVCGQFAKPNHLQIHDNTPEYTHGGQPQPLTPLQLLQRQTERSTHPTIKRPDLEQHSMQADAPLQEQFGEMRMRSEETIEPKVDSSIGTTHIIRHGPDGSKFVTKINGHPMVITEKIMEMVRSGRAKSIDDAINQLASSNQNLHLVRATSQPLPNYVYMNERQPLNPVYKNVPQVTVNEKVTSSSLYQNLPREAFIRPVDPEERRRWKEKLKRKKINAVRRIQSPSSTYYEVLTTPHPPPPPPPPPSTTRAPSRPVPATTTLPRPPLPPTEPSSFYKESFDLAQIRKHKERVRNGKIPPQRPLDDYEDDRVPYESDEVATVTPAPPPRAAPTAAPTRPPPTRATVVLPVSREEVTMTPSTQRVLPALLIHPTGTHFDLDDGKEAEEEEGEYEYDEDQEGLRDVEQQLTITQRLETTLAPVRATVPPTRPIVPLVRPTVPAPQPTVLPEPTFAARSRDAMERPLQLVPPTLPSRTFVVPDQTTSTTTTPRPRVPVPTPRVEPEEEEEEEEEDDVVPSAAPTRKSLWGSYESEEFEIRPASRGSI